MCIIDSKFVEHQPTQNTWTYEKGGKIIWKLRVPEGYSIHAGVFLNIQITVQANVERAVPIFGGGNNYWLDAFGVTNATFQAFEHAGLPFQQSITDVTIKLNNGGSQRYRNRDMLAAYLSTIVGDNISEANDGFKWYKGDQNIQGGNQRNNGAGNQPQIVYNPALGPNPADVQPAAVIPNVFANDIQLAQHHRTVDQSWARNKALTSKRLDFNTVSSFGSAAAGQNIANSTAIFKKMSPLFAPPFTTLGNCHGNLRGDHEIGKHSELLPGIKEYEIHLTLTHGQNLLRGMLGIDIIEDKPYDAYHLFAKKLDMTLVVQYTKLSEIPHMVSYLPALGTEIFKTATNVVNAGATQAFDFGLLRLGRIPKYLLLSAQISKETLIYYQGGIVNNQQWANRYVRTSAQYYQPIIENTRPFGNLKKLSITYGSGGEVLYRKDLDEQQIYWITRRSSPAKEHYPYDAFSFMDGKGAVLIDTSLCGLKGKFPNENALYEINISGEFENILAQSKHFYTQLCCIYTNYAFRLKSKTFDYVEKHS